MYDAEPRYILLGSVLISTVILSPLYCPWADTNSAPTWQRCYSCRVRDTIKRTAVSINQFTAHRSTHWHVSIDRSLQILRNYTFWWHTFTLSSVVDNTQHCSRSLLFHHQIAHKQLQNVIYRTHCAQESSMPGPLGRILDLVTSHRYTTVPSHVLTTRTEVIS